MNTNTADFVNNCITNKRIDRDFNKSIPKTGDYHVTVFDPVKKENYVIEYFFGADSNKNSKAKKRKSKNKLIGK